MYRIRFEIARDYQLLTKCITKNYFNIINSKDPQNLHMYKEHCWLHSFVKKYFTKPVGPMHFTQNAVV